jgi:hypothetical protein
LLWCSSVIQTCTTASKGKPQPCRGRTGCPERVYPSLKCGNYTFVASSTVSAAARLRCCQRAITSPWQKSVRQSHRVERSHGPQRPDTVDASARRPIQRLLIYQVQTKRPREKQIPAWPQSSRETSSADFLFGLNRLMHWKAAVSGCLILTLPCASPVDKDRNANGRPGKGDNVNPGHIKINQSIGFNRVFSHIARGFWLRPNAPAAPPLPSVEEGS